MPAASKVLLIFPTQREETAILKQYVIHHGRGNEILSSSCYASAHMAVTMSPSSFTESKLGENSQSPLLLVPSFNIQYLNRKKSVS
jgi:hypothetical protein